MGRTVYNSFFTVPTVDEQEFVGLQNFRDIFQIDDVIWQAVRHSVLWATVSPVLEIPIAFLLALALFAKVPGARFFRVAWFAPVLLSYVVVGPIWMWIYNHEWGAVNVALRAVGLGTLARPWLGDLTTALPALIVVTTWMFVGFYMVVLLAALSSVPASVLEAAWMDGAGWWRSVWTILIPLIRPTIANLIVLSVIGKLKQFALVWVMTNGGPLWATETVATYVIKRAFEWKTLDLGYPSAVATLWLTVMFAITILLMRMLQRREQLEF
jgi:ABC-type sugar transport system permease subunit